MANVQAAERALAQMEKKYDSLEAKIKQVSRSSKKSKEEEISLFDKMGQAAGTFATGLITVNAAVQAGTAVWNEYNKALETAAQREAKLGKELTTNLAQMGMAGGGARLKKFTESVPGVLPEQALAAFSGVQAGIPQSSVGNQERIARAVAGMSSAFAPVDETGAASDTGRLKEFGEATATLSQFFTKLPTDDLLDLAVAVQGSIGNQNLSQLRSGGFERAINDMVGGGMSPEQALATAAVGIDEGFNAKALRNEKEVGKLDKQRIADLQANFANAMRGNSAAALLADAQLLNPDAIALQDASASGAARAAGAGKRSLQTAQTERRLRRGAGLFSTGLSMAQEIDEGVTFSAAQTLGLPSFSGGMFGQLSGMAASAMGMDTSGMTVGAQVQSRSEQQSEKMIQLLEENNKIQREAQKKPQINRNAQTE